MYSYIEMMFSHFNFVDFSRVFIVFNIFISSCAGIVTTLAGLVIDIILIDI